MVLEKLEADGVAGGEPGNVGGLGGDHTAFHSATLGPQLRQKQLIYSKSVSGKKKVERGRGVLPY